MDTLLATDVKLICPHIGRYIIQLTSMPDDEMFVNADLYDESEEENVMLKYRINNLNDEITNLKEQLKEAENANDNW